MNFFIPLAGGGGAKDEHLWRCARDLLHENGFPTRKRRIHALYFWRDAEPRILQVGMEEEISGEPVLMIFRAADAPFYWVCTMTQGVVDGSPIPVPESRVSCAVGFDD